MVDIIFMMHYDDYREVYIDMKFAGIIENDIVDSIDGITVSFWTQGCKFHCKNCHNKHTWDINGGLELPNNYKELILDLIHKNGIHRNLSILGGEPLIEENRKIVSDLISFIKEKSPSTKVYLWTGFTYKQLKKEKDIYVKNILSKINFLIDGLYVDELRDITLKLRGSSNQHIYENKNGKMILTE